MNLRSESSFGLKAAARGSVLTLFSLALAASPVAAGPQAPQPSARRALFSGGCFWSLESAFDDTYGVIEAASGYAGGKTRSPNYGNYAAGGHAEAVLVVFDPSRIDYAGLLDVYFRHTDPTDPDGAFVDRGKEYRPVVWYLDEGQEAAALKAKSDLDRSKAFGKAVVVPVMAAPDFFRAEEYHQDYARKNPARYGQYRAGSGRERFFSSVWGPEAQVDHGAPVPGGISWSKPADAALRKSLTAIQYEVTQRSGTERAFDNPLWDEHRPGIFVDVVSGEPLFSSRDKYDSGTGWPSFTRPLVPGNIVVSTDTGLGMVRDEVRSRWAGSHLGHVFDDGPAPTGLRYCMNSASLRFVPEAAMEKEGYGYFLGYMDRM